MAGTSITQAKVIAETFGAGGGIEDRSLVGDWPPGNVEQEARRIGSAQANIKINGCAGSDR